jgi:hypothetical protein
MATRTDPVLVTVRYGSGTYTTNTIGGQRASRTGGPNAGRVCRAECSCGAMHSAGATAWTCAKHGRIVAD